ncbi:MAG: hypothetical protein KGL11_12735 [Alphaproteobacteria bacterium]|nr:hypothetical protein [Alphaproteobacteria bacterium]
MLENAKHAGAVAPAAYAKGEAALGAAVASVPFWVDWLHAGLSWFTLICGAIIGAHGVWRIVCRYRQKP